MSTTLVISAGVSAKQIVYRDLMPANVYVVSREDNPCFIKLLGCDIVEHRGDRPVQLITLAGSVMSTLQYMSPEQMSGRTVDARSDVWASPIHAPAIAVLVTDPDLAVRRPSRQ